MRTYSPLFLLAALGLLPAAGYGQPAVDTSNWKCSSCPFPEGTTGSVDVGLGAVSRAAARAADYTGLDRKGVYPVLGANLLTVTDSGYFARLQAADLGLDARSLSLQSGHEGAFVFSLDYSELPRVFTDQATTPFLGVGGSLLTLLAGYPASNTAGMPLASSLRPVDVGFKKQQLGVGLKVVQWDDWTYQLSLRRDVRDGTRPMYASFFSSSSQLVAPVDHVSDLLEVSAAYATRRFQAQVAYQVSRFSNNQPSLTWDSPFWPVVPGAGRGQLALAPDNDMHQLSASLGYSITPAIRASADLAVGRLTQNAPYVAPTLNANLGVTPSSLAVGSLDGRVDTFNANLKLTAALGEDWRINALLARDERDNRTAVHRYPLIATDIFVHPETRRNTPFDLYQDRGKLGVEYRGIEALRLSAGLDQDNRVRPYHAVSKTRETTLWGRAALEASEDLSLSLKVARADRSHSVYGTAIWFGSPENPLLRKYQLAERLRDTAGVRMDLKLSEEVALGVSADYANDAYDDSAVGLQSARSATLGVDLSVAVSEETQITLYAQSERIRSRQTGSEAWAAPDWRADNRDRFNVLGAGFRQVVIEETLDIGADLSIARSASDVTLSTALPTPAFPASKTASDTLRLFAQYKLNDQMTLIGNFWHERFEAQDWQLGDLQPGTLPNLLTLGEPVPSYRLNSFSVTLRYRF